MAARRGYIGRIAFLRDNRLIIIRGLEKAREIADSKVLFSFPFFDDIFHVRNLLLRLRSHGTTVSP